MRRYHRPPFVLIILALAILGTRAGAQENSWQSLVVSAVEALDNEHTAEAAKLLDDAVQATEKLGPKNVERAAALDQIAGVYASFNET